MHIAYIGANALQLHSVHKLITSYLSLTRGPCHSTMISHGVDKLTISQLYGQKMMKVVIVAPYEIAATVRHFCLLQQLVTNL